MRDYTEYIYILCFSPNIKKNPYLYIIFHSSGFLFFFWTKMLFPGTLFCDFVLFLLFYHCFLSCFPSTVFSTQIPEY